MNRWLPALAWTCLLGLGTGTGCLRDSNPASPEASPALEKTNGTADAKSPARRFEMGGSRKKPTAASAAPSLRFTAMAQSAGVQFTYAGGPSAEHEMPEQNGGGVAIFDFDRDGRLDVFLPNGTHTPKSPDQKGAVEPNGLYRQVDSWKYEEVAASAGVAPGGFGMGCATGDFDNDGFVDLYVTYFGANRLYRNQGDGTFADVTSSSGTGDARWGTSAAFADLDGDGDLDLYVVNYVEWSPSDSPCFTHHQPPIRISCGPIGRTAQNDVLYQNEGDGQFADVSRDAGIVQTNSKGLGVAIADLDRDGRLDIYVANDTTENNLYRNLGNMKFEDVGIAWGLAVGEDGLAHSGMGVACDDYDNNGLPDLLVTNFDNEPNDLYQNLSPGVFHVMNRPTGLDAGARGTLGFGTVFSDFDLDGWNDLLITNGHVWDLTTLGLAYRYRMMPLLYRNEAGGKFVEQSAVAGEYFQQEWLGRGMATGDLDSDGDSDVVVTHLENPAELLRNDCEHQRRSPRVEVIGQTQARDPRGLTLRFASGSSQGARWLPAGGSFQSASEPAVFWPVERGDVIPSVEVTWHDGTIERWRDLPVRSVIRLVEGTGERLAADRGK